MLTETQVEHFKLFGFLLLRNYLSEQEVATIRQELDAATAKAYRGKPFDGSERHWVPTMAPDMPFMSSLLEDPRFFDVAEQLFGEGVIPFQVDGNRYVGHTGWHPDSSVDLSESYLRDQEHAGGAKFIFYLEPLAADRGALRVLPGSHRGPLYHEVAHYLEEGETQKDPSVYDVPFHACETNPGDIVLFDMRLWHASYGGAVDRRMGTVSYFAKPSTAGEAAEITMLVEKIASWCTRESARRDEYPFYAPEWFANGDVSPRRAEMIERMRDAGFVDIGFEAEGIAAPV